MLQAVSRTLNNEELELEQILIDMRVDHPDFGETMALGHLCSLGYNISRYRLCQCIRRTDPINIALCWIGGPVVRRQYSVPGPNSLWHLGQHFSGQVFTILILTYNILLVQI